MNWVLVKSRDAFSRLGLVSGTLTVNKLKGQDPKRHGDQAARLPVLPAGSPPTRFCILPCGAPASCVCEAISETSPILMPEQIRTRSCLFGGEGRRANTGSAGTGHLLPKADVLLRSPAAGRSRHNSLPCPQQVLWGDASVAFKVTAAGTELEQISHWSLSNVSCSICSKSVKFILF